MAAVSISIGRFEDSHQAVIASNAPAAGMVEVRIANGADHELVKLALSKLLNRVTTDQLKGT